MTAATVVEDDRVRVRRMAATDEEYARMAGWLNEPHVREWWDPDGPEATIEQVRKTYGPVAADASSGTACIIEDRGTPAGYLQIYPWSSEIAYRDRVGITVEPEAWAFDVFIGDPGALGTGLASRALDLVCRHLVDDLHASAVVIVTELGNVRAHHVYENLGFRTVQEFLDEDTRGGQRVRSYVMRRTREWGGDGGPGAAAR